MNDPDPAALIPDYQSLMLPVLRAADHGEVRIGDVANVATSFPGFVDLARRAGLRLEQVG